MSLLFFIKPSTVNLDCFTSNIAVYEMAKIEPAIKFTPNWWRSLPNSYPSVWGEHPYFRDGTLKKCSGFLDLYKSGFILPMWCDLAIDVGPIGTDEFRYQYSNFESSAAVHPSGQRGAFCNEQNYQHLKLTSPWHLVCKNNINWIFMDVVWNDINLSPYRVLTGVVNYKFIDGTHINIILKREEKTKHVFIPYKTPLVHLIPMTEKKVKIKTHLVDSYELEKKKTKSKILNVRFENKLHELKKQMQCPIKHN